MNSDPRLERWLEALVRTPGLTAVTDLDQARSVHVEDALAALPLIEEGPVVDVGSGGGSPGLPLAAALPELQFVLLEASQRKASFLRSAAAGFPNVAVVCARAEEYGRGVGRDAFATAVARALAPPPVAVEWCLPLVRPGGHLVLYVTRSNDRCAAVAKELGGFVPNTAGMLYSGEKRLLVVRKLRATPARYPRRPGVARKRPLA